MSSSIFRLAGEIAASAQAQRAGDDLDGGHPTMLKHTPLRRLPISDKALSVLNKAKELQPVPNCPFVFPNRLGNKRTTLSNTWIRIKKAANIPAEFDITVCVIRLRFIWHRLVRFRNIPCKNC